jgi:hypothetical protein
MMNHKETAIAKCIRAALDKGDYDIQDVASRLGFRAPNMITAIAAGDIKLPLDKAFPLADILKEDRFEFFMMALEQHLDGRTMAEFREAIKTHFGREP